MERVQAQCPLHSPRSTCKPRGAGWDLGSPSLELLFYCKTCATCSLPPAGVLGLPLANSPAYLWSRNRRAFWSVVKYWNPVLAREKEQFLTLGHPSTFFVPVDRVGADRDLSSAPTGAQGTELQ